MRGSDEDTISISISIWCEMYILRIVSMPRIHISHQKEEFSPLAQALPTETNVEGHASNYLSKYSSFSSGYKFVQEITALIEWSVY